MESSPETRRTLRARLRGALSVPVLVALMTAVVVALGVTTATAQPNPPDNAADAATRLQQVQREAEALTEEWHAAGDALEARTGELEQARQTVEPLRVAAETARAEEERYRAEVDTVVLAAYESGRFDQFNALLASGSPQDFLDQMSALETISVDNRSVLAELLAVADTTAAAQAEADAAAARAQAAADEATRAEQEAAQRKADADTRIEEAEELLARLTPRERADRLGPDEDAPSTPVSGTGVGVRALNAARTQLGKPYRWGASGPDSFDCSGLTLWAFAEAGVTLPRSSSTQAGVGRQVSFGDLQPGDLVFYYSPISHVGIYAGDGKMINAPQTGDVVKYASVSRDRFTTARRL